MIGVIANPQEHEVAREFFELFKTPWEFCRKDRQYDVLLCAGEGQFDTTAKVSLVYAGRKTDFDVHQKTPIGRQARHGSVLSYQGNQIPIYGDTVTFPEKERGLLTEEGSQECAAFLEESSGKVMARIGYDLFAEIRSLLTVGQPAANANVPTLELHIALLRNLITGCGVPLTEIPPVPDGYRFIACLTHDVDHPSIRQHKWDHTMLGFLYRAAFGSLLRSIRGQMPVRDLLTNWSAALKLPFVYLGLAKDFWRDFDERYLELEKGLPSTFFVIPFKAYPGLGPSGPAPKFRAGSYEARDIAEVVRKLQAAGHEVGLHGIDAWCDSSKARSEIEEIRRLTGVSETGVRMHWLYYDQQSSAVLERAGATYDSTIGYNETVGYRAGTTQAYKPFEVSRLLELPMHVMDTALFYPSYLNLSSAQARTLLGQVADCAAKFGGVLTINWHDRSVAPERLWNASYRDLVQDMQTRGAWFATAGQAVSWFRKRRSVAFETDSDEPARVFARVAPDSRDYLPGLRLRIHKTGEVTATQNSDSEGYVDVAIEESKTTCLSSGAKT